MGTGLACQDAVCRVFRQFGNQTKLFIRSKPRPLVGNPDQLLTLDLAISVSIWATTSFSFQPILVAYTFALLLAFFIWYQLKNMWGCTPCDPKDCEHQINAECSWWLQSLLWGDCWINHPIGYWQTILNTVSWPHWSFPFGHPSAKWISVSASLLQGLRRCGV